MTSYPLSAYGSNPNAGKSPNGAASRGWGSGWPNCQTSKMVKVVSDAGHHVNVRREIGQLVATLFQIQVTRGYDPNPGTLLQTWGFACRAIANTRTASNHSWGLAIDNRATENPYSTTFKSTIPPKVVNDWEVCGFYWGGRYTNKKDTMHFEYIGRPADVAGHLAKAKAILKSLQPGTPPSKPPTTPPEDDMGIEFTTTVPGLKDQNGDPVNVGQALFRGVRAYNEGPIEGSWMDKRLDKIEFTLYGKNGVIEILGTLDQRIKALVANEVLDDATVKAVGESLEALKAKVDEMGTEVPPVPNP